MDLLVEQGTVLAASADMLDPNFMHAVVLMCQHSAEGAYGLVLNRPSSQTTDMLLAGELALGALPAPIFVGGPVGLDTLQVLHRAPDRIPGGIQVADDLWIGGDLEQVGAYLRENGPESARVRILMGYSGWGEGQLEAELASGSWLPVPGAAGKLLDEPPAQMWRALLRRLGPLARGLEDQPPDPSWN